jgi:hypothetical protein
MQADRMWRRNQYDCKVLLLYFCSHFHIPLPVNRYSSDIIRYLGIESLDLHGGKEDIEEANHYDGEVQKVPRVPARIFFLN